MNGSDGSYGSIYYGTTQHTIGNNSPINSGKKTIPELPQNKSINKTYYSQNKEKPVQHIYNSISNNLNSETFNNVFNLGELKIKLKKKEELNNKLKKKEELNNKLDNLLFNEKNSQAQLIKNETQKVLQTQTLQQIKNVQYGNNTLRKQNLKQFKQDSQKAQNQALAKSAKSAQRS